MMHAPALAPQSIDPSDAASVYKVLGGAPDDVLKVLIERASLARARNEVVQKTLEAKAGYLTAATAAVVTISASAHLTFALAAGAIAALGALSLHRPRPFAHPEAGSFLAAGWLETPRLAAANVIAVETKAAETSERSLATFAREISWVQWAIVFAFSVLAISFWTKTA